MNLPWDDLKVAYSIDNDDAVWDAFYVKHTHTLPLGWELDETDCSGARCVAVFRVTGPLREENGEHVQELLIDCGAIFNSSGGTK